MTSAGPVIAAAVANPPDTQSPANGNVAVRFSHVAIGYNGHQVLFDVNFSACTGEMRILLGPAGGGKSVLLKLANGLERPDSGSIEIFGEEITTLKEKGMYRLRQNIGMVFQESALFDSLTVRDNVAYQLREAHEDEAEIERKVVESLRFVELEDAIGKFPSQLSGGMRRRVAIARAIISQPKLLLYDSPTGGLDPVTSTTIIELVMKQRDVYDSTALLVTHRLQDAFMLATHCFNRATNRMERIPGNGTDANTTIMVLNEGRIVFDGTLLQLLASDDPYIKEFLS